MNEHLEFVTSKKQYMFSLLIRNMEMSFVGSLATAISSAFINENNEFQMTSVFLTLAFMTLALFVLTILYVQIKLSLFRAELPKITLSDSGLLLNELGKIEQVDWTDITNIEIKGWFRKIIKLSNNKHSQQHEIEYYLFRPEQRRKILPAISARLSKPHG